LLRRCAPLRKRFAFVAGNDVREHDSAFSRRDAPEVCNNLVPQKTEGAGKAGCLAHPQPPVQQKSTGVEATGSPEVTRPSLRNGFNGFLRALPGDRACLPPSPADHSANLTPASGCQDHTTSPSAG
jgi:hypothetical protein